MHDIKLTIISKMNFYGEVSACYLYTFLVVDFTIFKTKTHIWNQYKSSAAQGNALYSCVGLFFVLICDAAVTTRLKWKKAS